MRVLSLISEVLNAVFARFLFLALHIDNPNAFPPPLKAAEERELLQRYANGDEQARVELIERNLRLVVHIVKKYYAASAEQDDLISIGTIGLIKAINTFDSGKGVRLATYASRCIENEILMYFRSLKKSAQDVSLDDPIETDSEGNPLTLMDILSTDDTVFEDVNNRMDIHKLRRFVSEIHDPREKTIVSLRYGMDGSEPLTQNQIAAMLGISRSYVSRIETKSLKKLRKRFENE